MQKKKNTRLIVLSILAVLAAIFYIVVANPISPLANMCEDVDYATQQYANKNIKKRNKFIVERNKHCKVLVSERKNVKDIYGRIENCTILDCAMDASDKYIDLSKTKNNKGAIKKNVRYYANLLDKYDYCPQYGEVSKKLHDLENVYH